MNIENIVKNFKFKGEFVNGYRYGSGHINQTYVAIFKQSEFNYRRYLLQKINHQVFKNVEGLMSNIKHVTEFQRQSILNQGGNPDLESLTLVDTLDDKYFYKHVDGTYWRAYYFIEEGIGFDFTENPKHFFESGIAFGRFQNDLAQFDTALLTETIPNFHHTGKRFEAFLEALDKNLSGRKALAKKEIDFYLERKNYTEVITSLLDTNQMPYRVTHNDTKLNNVLISPITHKAICVIDLDTIMKGSIVYDFGDSIRFGANTSSEDEKDLNKVNFSLELFETYAKAFIGEVKGSLQPIEIEHMAFGAILMTYECGMRFLTDYLNGDTYFRTKYDDHNLVRARTQMKLVSDMESVFDQMKAIVHKVVQTNI